MGNLKEKAEEFIKWLEQLKQVTADSLNIDVSEVKINEEEASKYMNDNAKNLYDEIAP